MPLWGKFPPGRFLCTMFHHHWLIYFFFICAARVFKPQYACFQSFPRALLPLTGIMANSRHLHATRSMRANPSLKDNPSQSVAPFQGLIVPSTISTTVAPSTPKQCSKHIGTGLGGHAAQLEKAGNTVGKKKAQKLNVRFPDDEPVNTMASTPWQTRKRAPQSKCEIICRAIPIYCNLCLMFASASLRCWLTSSADFKDPG